MKITKNAKVALFSAVEELCRQAKHKRFRFGYERLALMYWSRQEFEAVKVAKGLVDRDCFDHTGRTFQLDVEINHELMHPTMQKVIIHVNNGNEPGVCLWPRDMFDVRDEADPADVAALQDMAVDLIKQAMDLTLLRKVTKYLFDNCDTHEQIRYVFPPYMQILSKAGYDEAASNIAEIKSAPKNLPPLDTQLRSEIRYLIQWFTIQHLLGTFESRMIWYEGDSVGCDVSIGGPIYLKNMEGRPLNAIFN